MFWAKVLVVSGGSRIFERGVADLTERYQNVQRQNYLSDSSVPFHNFKLKRPQRGGWLATQSTRPGSAPGCTGTLTDDIYMESYVNP